LSSKNWWRTAASISVVGLRLRPSNSSNDRHKRLGGVRLDRIPACDRQTFRRTSCDGIVRTMHTRRTIKTRGKSNVKTLAVSLAYTKDSGGRMFRPWFRLHCACGRGLWLPIGTAISDHQLRAPRLTARGSWLTGLCFWQGMKWKYASGHVWGLDLIRKHTISAILQSIKIVHTQHPGLKPLSS